MANKSSRPSKTDALISKMDRDRDITSRISRASDSGSSSVEGRDNLNARLGEQAFRITKAKAGASNPPNGPNKSKR